MILGIFGRQTIPVLAGNLTGFAGNSAGGVDKKSFAHRFCLDYFFKTLTIKALYSGISETGSVVVATRIFALPSVPPAGQRQPKCHGMPI